MIAESLADRYPRVSAAPSPPVPATIPDLQVIGADERRLVRNTQSVPFRYICKLECLFRHPRTGARRRGGCTGALISPTHVLTAAHCLYKPGYGYAYSVRVIPAKNGRGHSQSKEPFGHAFSLRLNVPTPYRQGRTVPVRRPYDYGVVTLRAPLGRRVGWWPGIVVAPTRLLLGRWAHTAGYPGDKGGQHLYYAHDRIVRVHARRLEYLHDTFGGQSGSPIWMFVNGQRMIVGVHNTRDLPGAPLANTGIRITPEVLEQVRRWMKG